MDKTQELLEKVLTSGLGQQKKAVDGFNVRLLNVLVISMLGTCAAGHFVYVAAGSVPSVVMNLTCAGVLVLIFWINRLGYNEPAWHIGLSSPAALFSVYTLWGHAVQTSAFIVLSFFIISLYIFKGRKVVWYYSGLFMISALIILLSPYFNPAPIPHAVFLYFYKGFLGMGLFLGFMLVYDRELRSSNSTITTLIRDLRRQKESLEKRMKEKTLLLEKSVETLRRSNRDLEQFAYLASHDLQEPLRMIGNYVRLIDRRYNRVLDNEGKEYIRFAMEGTYRMSNLIQKLLEFAKLDQDGTKTGNALPELVIREKLKDIQTLIREKNADITLETMPDVVDCDPDHLGIIFQNLISNGIKYNVNDRPSITISGRDCKKYWLFRVSDNGIGIRKEDQQSIFDLFKRLHNRIEYEGLGIGLAACKKIVSQYEGEIWIDSDLKKGSTFYFTINKKAQSKALSYRSPNLYAP